MAAKQVIEREWILAILVDEVQVRCRYRRLGNQVLQYTVQLEFWHGNDWQPILRYVNAHGFCHRDTIHADGTQDKTPIYRGDANYNFTWAIKDKGYPCELAVRDGPVLGGGETVMDRKDFADKQLELATEFAQYVADHPELDALLAERSQICFQIEGETEFNRYSREVAERHRRDEGAKIVLVRIKGLAPPQGSRLIDPIIEPVPAIA